MLWSIPAKRCRCAYEFVCVCVYSINRLNGLCIWTNEQPNEWYFCSFWFIVYLFFRLLSCPVHIFSNWYSDFVLLPLFTSRKKKSDCTEDIHNFDYELSSLFFHENTMLGTIQTFLFHLFFIINDTNDEMNAYLYLSIRFSAMQWLYLWVTKHLNGCRKVATA